LPRRTPLTPPTPPGTEEQCISVKEPKKAEKGEREIGGRGQGGPGMGRPVRNQSITHLEDWGLQRIEQYQGSELVLEWRWGREGRGELGTHSPPNLDAPHKHGELLPVVVVVVVVKKQQW